MFAPNNEASIPKLIMNNNRHFSTLIPHRNKNIISESGMMNITFIASVAWAHITLKMLTYAQRKWGNENNYYRQTPSKQ